MLERKYIEKEKIASYSEKVQCYNNAVSAYYYNILLRLKYYLLIKEIEIEKDTNSTHIKIIDSVIEEASEYIENKKITFSDYAHLNDIYTLKDCRVKADYSEKYEFNKAKYDNEFKLKYDIIDKVLKKIGI